MEEQYRDFGARLKRIDRRHRKLAAGYVASMGNDGLIVAVPRRRRLRVPFAGIALLAVGIIGLKGLMLAHLGPEAYDTRVAVLSQGTQVERAGAWVMQADPLTRWVATHAAPMLR